MRRNRMLIVQARKDEEDRSPGAEGARPLNEVPKEFTKANTDLNALEESQTKMYWKAHKNHRDFDQRAIQIEQKLQSEYSNIINYAKEKLKMNNLRITISKHRKAENGRTTLSITPAAQLAQGLPQPTVERVVPSFSKQERDDHSKEKEIMIKYIKYFHVKKRREELRIGGPNLPPSYVQQLQANHVKDLEQQYKIVPKEMFDHKIYDFWSMNFFGQARNEDMRVSKKEQLDQIKESIQKSKSWNKSRQDVPPIKQFNDQLMIVARSEKPSPEKTGFSSHRDSDHPLPSEAGAPEGSPKADQLSVKHNNYILGMSEEEKFKLRGMRKTSFEKRKNYFEKPNGEKKSEFLAGMRLQNPDADKKPALIRSFTRTSIDQSSKQQMLNKNLLHSKADQSGAYKVQYDALEKPLNGKPLSTNASSSTEAKSNSARDRQALPKTQTKQLPLPTVPIEELKRTKNPEVLRGSMVRDWQAAGPGPGSCDRIVLTNLFHGLLVTSGVTNIKSEGLGFLVGEGNNQPLVQKHLGNLKPLVQLSFFNRANIIWTQLPNKMITGTTDAPKLDLATLGKIRDFQAFSNFDIDLLTNSFLDLQLFDCRSKELIRSNFEKLLDSKEAAHVVRESLSVPNHIKGLKEISWKNMLMLTMTRYIEQNSLQSQVIIPKTYLLTGDTFDRDLEEMMRAKNQSDIHFENPLIIKPGQLSNRGIGISIAFSMTEAIKLCKETLEKRKSCFSVIVQEYISRPLLFRERKFDVRCYGLVVKFFNRINFYWYKEGYARTSSFTYDTNIKDNLKVHLTNEAVQVKGSLRSPRCQDLRQVRAGQQDLLPGTGPVLRRSGRVPGERHRLQVAHRSDVQGRHW